MSAVPGNGPAFEEAIPTSALRKFVRKYAQLDLSINSGSPQLWPIPARSCTCLEFTFGEPYRIHYLEGSPPHDTFPCILIGAKTRQRIRLELTKQVQTFSVLFQPTGLQELFRIPGSEIVDGHYGASDILGSSISSLFTQLGETALFGARVHIADAFFCGLLRSPRLFGNPDIAAIVQQMTMKSGCVPIPELAHVSGISLRHFERRFARHLGMTPKHFARVLRFEAAIQYKKSAKGSWLSVAHELGYHDQMHMIHDFRSLSGHTPESLKEHLDILSLMSGGSGSRNLVR